VATARQWVAGTRPRTLPAAIVPVMIGSGVAAGYGGFSPGRGALALIVALSLQVGVNYSNDYSDGIRDTDAVGKRVGPMRLVGSGLAAPRHVMLAAFACFAVAGAVGLALAASTSWWLVPVGVCCVLGAWCYTGGPRPYGYMGLGEVAVFVFFGVVAVTGAAFVEMRHVTWLGLLASVPAGLLSCGLLMINNLRDIKSDPLSGKRTLAVRIGDRRSRTVYALFVLVPFVLAVALAFARPYTLLTLLALPFAGPPLRTVRGGATGPALITVLGQTSRLQIAFGLAFTIGLALHA
jgi:1,4-dihydroxy-2-naphthoate polyprenyltransferase